MLFKTVLKVFHVNYPFALIVTPWFPSLGEFSSFSHSIAHKTGRDDWTILKKEEAEAKIYFRL